MQIAKKGPDNTMEGFTSLQRYLIDHPQFQGQTSDLVEALHFLSQFWDEPRATLVEGFGPFTREIDWRDMLVRLNFSSTARH